MKVYFISGLGADDRVFRQLSLPGIEPVYLNWIPPVKNETIESYAGRMAERITEPDPVIVGLSFGGMIGMEIAKLIPVKKLILISSAKGEKELPPYFLMGRSIPLYKLFPVRLNNFTAPIFFYLFGIKNKEQKKNLEKMINNCPEDFNRWAMDKVVNWTNKEYATHVIHIHGNADHLLPYRYVKADHTIEKGTHFMIVENANEISALLLKLIPH